MSKKKEIIVVLNKLQIKFCSMHEISKKILTHCSHVTDNWTVPFFLCGNWIHCYVVQKNGTNPAITHNALVHSHVNSQSYTNNYFLCSSGAGMNTENNSVFNVYFSNFLVTRYRQDVVYSWKGLLGELLNTYASSN
jgi:hypothetical protein